MSKEPTLAHVFFAIGFTLAGETSTAHSHAASQNHQPELQLLYIKESMLYLERANFLLSVDGHSDDADQEE